MPPNLKKAHLELDKAVDKCYRNTKFKDDNDRMNFYLIHIKNITVNNLQLRGTLQCLNVLYRHGTCLFYPLK